MRLLESQSEYQTDRLPLLMDQRESASHREHVIDVPRGTVASSSISYQDNHDISNELRYDAGPQLPESLSRSSSSPTTASNSQNASLRRRGDNRGRRNRSPLNSVVWISIEVVVNVSQIIAAIVVLSVSRNEHPRAPLFEWVIGYTVGCIATLPHLYWRYVHRNRQNSEQEQAQPSQDSSQNTPDSNTYLVVSSARTSQGERDSNSTAVSRANGTTASPRIHALIDHFKLALDCFFAVWFVVGNVWIFGGHASIHDAPNLYREDLNQNRGASAESINALPTHKFKLKRPQNADGSEIQGQCDCGGILAAGTDKERIISAEDAVCCICLARYADNDELRELPCAHFFHVECVDKWLKINALCPLCKAEVGNSTSSSSISFGRRHGDRRVGNDVESQQSQ